METLRKEMAAPVPELAKDKDPKSVYRAALFLLNKTLKDKVFSVSAARFRAGGHRGNTPFCRALTSTLSQRVTSQ